MASTSILKNTKGIELYGQILSMTLSGLLSIISKGQELEN